MHRALSIYHEILRRIDLGKCHIPSRVSFQYFDWLLSVYCCCCYYYYYSKESQA